MPRTIARDHPAGPPARRHRKAECVLEAAREIFLRQGYGNTGMDAVAKAAGVSKATIYAHFRSKEELLGAIVEAESRAQDWGGMLLSPNAPPRQTLTSYGRQLLTFLVSPRVVAMIRLVVAETQHFPELGAAVLQAGPMAQRDKLAAYLRRLTELHQLAVPDAELAAGQFIGLLKSDLQTRCLLDPTVQPAAEDVERQVDGAVKLFLGAYAATP